MSEGFEKFMGEIETHVRYIREKTDAINDKVDKVGVHSIRQGMQLDAFHDRLDDTNQKHDKLEKKIDTHQSKIAELNNLKSKSLGFMAGVSAAASALMMFLSKFLGFLQ